MRKSLILLIAGVFITGTLSAQNLHATLFAGAANYQGDLQDKRYTFDQAHFAGGVGLLYELSDRFYARANVTFGKVSGDDKKTSRVGNIPRNLNFTSNILDGHLGLEFHFFSLYEKRITPYVFGGVSVYHFDPYTYDSAGTKVMLQPLGTEGQGFFQGRQKYKLTQIAIPIGGGIRFALSDNVRVGFEIGLRKLFTDYLDDVSDDYAGKAELLAFSGQQAVDIAFREDELKAGALYPDAGSIRGNPKSKDWYYFSGLTLSFRINSGEGGMSRMRRSGKNKYGCPTNVY